MKVALIILNWNGAKYISHCLDSVNKLEISHCHFEKIIVDNNSTDNSIDLIEKKYSDYTLLRSPTNLGYAQGNNVGIRYALNHGADFIWILNSDMILAPDSLIKYLEGATKYPQASVFGAKIYFAPGYEFHKDRYTKDQLGKVIWYAGGYIDWANIQSVHRGVDQVDENQFLYDGETDFVTGASMFIRRQVFETVGLFDPKYFLYFEENDLCQRCLRNGIKLMFLAQVIAWHENAQATGMGSPLQDYFITRNQLLFGLRYAPLRSKQALLRQAYHLYSAGRVWQRQAISDYFHSRFGRGSYK